jgi:pyruvate,water dikinase
MMKGSIGFLRSVFDSAKRAAYRPLPFNVLLEKFRQILESNNRALEIIADMGEKLGGDYLFDVNYIKKAYSQLSEALGDSVQKFDVLTRRKYTDLHTVYKRIDNQIRNTIYDLPLISGKRVVFFEDITWDMRRDVGGKNAGLSDLKNILKLNVPYGFSITTYAFDEFMRHNMLNERVEKLIADNRHSGARLEELRGLIVGSEIPADLGRDIDSAIDRVRAVCGEKCSLAVRSSAEEEDGEISFAGQFDTVLNVPAAGEDVGDAYKKVIASLFSDHAMTYQKTFGYDVGKLKMAVGCMTMVDAISSGVIYSVNPHGDNDTMIINSLWGLGRTVVEGKADADLYTVRRDISPELISEKLGAKEVMTVNAADGGTVTVNTPDELKGRSSLNPEQLKDLAVQAIFIEKYFGKPQDIEWAIDKTGKVFMLQSRQIRTGEEKKTSVSRRGPVRLKTALMTGKGIVVQKGVGAGRVFIAENIDELGHFPRGSVLVAKYDSSNFVRLMPYVSAIITDTGTPTSHMASLCREFRVPAIVNTGDATSVLRHGQEVTVYAHDGDNVIYEGIVKELAEYASSDSPHMESLYEYRKKRYVLRYISPLNLIDPLMDSFTPAGCKTIHDVIRFIHEKSITGIIDNAVSGANLKDRIAAKLELPIPADIIAIDIGGGLDVKDDASKKHGGRKNAVKVEQITSIPLKAVIRGMLYPGAWHSETIPLRMNDLITSMTRMSDIISESRTKVFQNVAVVSKDYMNLNMKFGYHFNVLDCYCSETARNNHIYFRFAGGATDILKRSRRVQLIAIILKRYGFNVMAKGDLLIGRLANMKQEEMEAILDKLGRLIAYIRKLDALLRDDAAVERYAKRFMEENYELK